MSKETIKDKLDFLGKHYLNTASWRDVYHEQLLPTLELKMTKNVIVKSHGANADGAEEKQEYRTSKFIKLQKEKIDKILSGEMNFQHEMEKDQNIKSQALTISKSDARHKKLLAGNMSQNTQ